MSVFKRRSRMISFRVSEDEYDGLRNLCINEGARSVSDMARDAVQRLITRHSCQNNQLETVVQALQGKIEFLDMEVKRLGKVLSKQAGAQGVATRNGDGEI